MIEAHDEWQVAERRYLSEGFMALLNPPVPTQIGAHPDTVNTTQKELIDTPTPSRHSTNQQSATRRYFHHATGLDHQYGPNRLEPRRKSAKAAPLPDLMVTNAAADLKPVRLVNRRKINVYFYTREGCAVTCGTLGASCEAGKRRGPARRRPTAIPIGTDSVHQTSSTMTVVTMTSVCASYRILSRGCTY